MVQESILRALTELVKTEIELKGANYVAFAESVTIVGQYGDRAGTKHLFIKDGRLKAHVYNCWMENMGADLEYNLLSEDTLKMLRNKIRFEC